MPVKDIGTAALFAGTTEGRLLAERLAGGPVKVHVFVATEYGGEGLPQAENILVHEGRMDQEEIREELSRLSCDLVLDATHPFAPVSYTHLVTDGLLVFAQARFLPENTGNARVIIDGGEGVGRVTKAGLDLSLIHI